MEEQLNTNPEETAAVAGGADADADESLPKMVFSDEELQVIQELRANFKDTIDLEVELQRGIYQLEMSYQPKQQALFEERKKLLDKMRQQNYGDAESTGELQHFWLQVLKTAYGKLISEKDEKMLVHLNNISAAMFDDPAKFEIRFHFDENEYFSNDVLTKTYYLKSKPDPETPLIYEGTEIVNTEGCFINWIKDPSSNEEEEYSFFDYFNPPSLPEDRSDASFSDISSILQSDFQMGFYIKERLVPKAILFFTGEITDGQSPTSASESSSAESESMSESDPENNSTSNEAIQGPQNSAE